MQRSGARAAAGVLMAGLLALLVGCGAEAESKDENSADTVQAVDALRREVRQLRADLIRMTGANEGLQDLVGRLELELHEAGPVDPYLHERSQGMDYIARKWGDKSYKQNIEAAVAALKAEGHAAIFGIIPVLRDADSDRRMAALYVLEEMGPAATGAIEHIRERLKDPDAAVRASASRALCEIAD